MKAFSIWLLALAACFVVAESVAQTTPPSSGDTSGAGDYRRTEPSDSTPSYRRIEPPSLGEMRDPTPIPDYRLPTETEGAPTPPTPDTIPPYRRFDVPGVTPPLETTPGFDTVPDYRRPAPSTEQPGEIPGDIRDDLQFTPPGGAMDLVPPRAPAEATPLEGTREPAPLEPTPPTPTEPTPARPFAEPAPTVEPPADEPERLPVEIRVIRPGTKRLVYNAQVAIFTIGENSRRIRSGMTGLGGGPFDAEQRKPLDPSLGKLLVVAARGDKIGSTVIVYDPDKRNWRPEPAYDKSQWDIRKDWRPMSRSERIWRPLDETERDSWTPEPIRVLLDEDRAGVYRASTYGRPCGCS